jgi:hypothetical protein
LLAARYFGCGALVLLLIVSGCATKQQAGIVRSGPLPAAQVVLSEPGRIAVKAADGPALLGVGQAEGRMGHVGGNAGDTATRFLNPPRLGDPALEAVWSVAGTALAPFAAAASAVRATGARLPAAKLEEAKADLAKAMKLVTDQGHFRDVVLSAGNERSPGSLVPTESLARSEAEAAPVGAVLATAVEELRLVRTGKEDSSFALRVKARARLFRADGCAVLYDYPVEYQSGTALFIDWTYPEAFRGVVETAYRELAAQMAQRLLPANPEGPVMVGAGYKKVHTSKSVECVPVVARRTVRPALIQVVSASPDYQGAIGVFSTANSFPVAVPQPLSRDDAVPTAIERSQWALDGLQDSRNLPVQLVACAAAIPISLWHQAVIGIGCPSGRKAALAESELSVAAREVRPQKHLAVTVAGYLAQKTSQPVVLVECAPPSDVSREPEGVLAGNPGRAVAPVFAGASGGRPKVTLCGLRGTRVGAGAGQSAESYVLGEGPDTALQVEVLDAALRGNGQVNPGLAICVEARARLLRVSDGQELYSGLLHYRGQKHKFTVWAANDARLFRQEMEQWCQELSHAAVDQLAARHLIIPGVRVSPTLVAGAER